MKKKVFGFLVVFMFVAAGLATNAGALGLGGYFTLMTGSTEWDADFDIDYDNGESDSISADGDDVDEVTSGLGFVLDTAVARDELFNYRFQIGLEVTNVEFDDATAKLSGLAMTHDFGVGVLRTKDVRIWIGPELRLAFKGGTLEFDDEPDELDFDDDINIATFHYGIGPVVGGNFHLGNMLTLAVKTGFVWETMTGVGEFEGTYTADNGEETDFDGDIDFDSSDVYFFVTFSVFYRLGDTF